MVDTLQPELPPGGISLEGIEKFFQGPAKHLDISRKALRYRIEKYGIAKKGLENEEGLDLLDAIREE